LAASVNCPKCGAANVPGVSFCANCGAAMTVGPAGPAMTGPPPYGAPGYPPFPGGPPYDLARKKQINWTKWGVLLLLIGTLLGWIPYVLNLVGGLLVLIGAILVIIGRKAFGPAHSRNVIISIILFFVGFAVGVVAVIALAGALAASLFGGTPTQAGVQSALNTYLILLVVTAAVGGIANVLFIFALQNKIGRLLLFAAYASSIVIEVALFVLLSGTLSQFLSAAFPGGTYNSAAAAAALTNFSNQARTLGLLSVIPALLYAAADYVAWSRINRGEIPEGPKPGTMPPPMPLR
jgi:zinc ribbon protein